MATNKDFKVKNGIQLAGQLASTLATGTAPLSVASTTPVPNLSIGGNAATATTATNTTITDDTTTAAPYYLTWVTGTGNLPQKISSTKLTFNPSTGIVTATGFSGTLTGNATNVTGTVAIANGGTGATTAAGALTALGATTVGANFVDLINPSAITFPRINADNTVSALDAATFRTAIGAGTGSGSGTVTSVSVTTASGISGTVATNTTTPAISLSVATQAYGDATTNVATTAFVDQLRDVPSNAQAGAYTLVLTDRGKCIDANGNITIPANTAVAFPIGAVIGFVNVSAAAITIAITTDTMHLAGTATVGTRTLASWGMASVRKVSSTVWVISGAGLT